MNAMNGKRMTKKDFTALMEKKYPAGLVVKLAGRPRTVAGPGGRFTLYYEVTQYRTLCGISWNDERVERHCGTWMDGEGFEFPPENGEATSTSDYQAVTTPEELKRRASECPELSHWVDGTNLTESELLTMYFDYALEFLESDNRWRDPDDERFAFDFDLWATDHFKSNDKVIRRVFRNRTGEFTDKMQEKYGEDFWGLWTESEQDTYANLRLREADAEGEFA